MLCSSDGVGLGGESTELSRSLRSSPQLWASSLTAFNPLLDFPATLFDHNRKQAAIFNVKASIRPLYATYLAPDKQQTKVIFL